MTNQATINEKLIKIAQFTHEPNAIQALISQGAEVNSRNKDGMTALMMASKFNNNPEIVNCLVANGAEINAVNNKIDRYTPIMMAAGYNLNPAVTEELVNLGADVTMKDWQHSNALEWSFVNENSEIWGYLSQA